jgi:hypothetical protein
MENTTSGSILSMKSDVGIQGKIGGPKSEDLHKRRRDFKLSDIETEKLDVARKRLNLRSRTDAVSYLVGAYLEETGNVMPIASFENIMFNEDSEDTTRTPIAIVAKPKGGKSVTIDAYLKECAKRQVPFLIFCQKTEPRAFSWIPKRKKYRSFNAGRILRSKLTIQVRVDLDPDENIRLGEVERICEDLIRLENDKHLKDWIIVFDEGSSYVRSPAFLQLLGEIRKYVNRLITTSTEHGLFKACEEMSPIPKKSK